MKIAERHNLKLVKELYSDNDFQLNLLEDDNLKLFLSCSSDKPQGTVYFETTVRLLCEFIIEKITLQDLFNNSPSLFVEIIGEFKRAIYSRNDTEIILTNGRKLAHQITEKELIKISA